MPVAKKSLATTRYPPLTARMMPPDVSPAAPTAVTPAPPTAADMDGLLLRVAAHDKAAFSDVFDHFAPRLNAYMRKLGADATQAEEVVQETMLQVWRKAGHFNAAKASASTWVFTIARNKRIDLLRKARHPEVDLDDPALVHAQVETDNAVSDPAETRSTTDALQLAIASLPPEQAELIQLAFFEDKAHGEIAGLRKLPLGTVKSRLRLALGKLRHQLKKRETA